MDAERVPVDRNEVILLDGRIGAERGDGNLSRIGTRADVELHLAGVSFSDVRDHIAVEVPAADHSVPLVRLVRVIDVDLVPDINAFGFAECDSSESLITPQIDLLVRPFPQIVFVLEEPSLGRAGVSLSERVDHLSFADQRLRIP